MASFVVTPKNKIVPAISVWTMNTPSVLPFADQYRAFIATLHTIERDAKIQTRLSPIDVYSNVEKNETLSRVVHASLPLRQLFIMKTSILKLSPEWLTYWELYYRTIVATLQQKITLRKKANTKKLQITYRSFHIADNAAASVHSLQKALNRVEFLTGAQINHNWLATYTDSRSLDEQTEHIKFASQWLSGVTEVDSGESTCTVGNMRAWKNTISTKLRTVDLVVSNESTFSPNVISFAMINLTIGGTAMIYLPTITDAATINLIHLFAQCFETTNIYHMVATDRLYLVGDNFLSNLTQRLHKILYDYASVRDMNLFNDRYVASEEFIDTVEKLTNVNHIIYNWRYEYYDKLFRVYDEISNSESARTFSEYIDRKLAEEYPDDSKQWTAATNFNFLV